MTSLVGLCPLMDAQAQADAMDRLLDDPERRLAWQMVPSVKRVSTTPVLERTPGVRLMCGDTDETA